MRSELDGLSLLLSLIPLTIPYNEQTCMALCCLCLTWSPPTKTWTSHFIAIIMTMSCFRYACRYPYTHTYTDLLLLLSSNPSHVTTLQYTRIIYTHSWIRQGRERGAQRRRGTKDWLVMVGPAESSYSNISLASK